jgi:hypothetical protein
MAVHDSLAFQEGKYTVLCTLDLLIEDKKDTVNTLRRPLMVVFSGLEGVRVATIEGTSGGGFMVDLVKEKCCPSATFVGRR